MKPLSTVLAQPPQGATYYEIHHIPGEKGGRPSPIRHSPGKGGNRWEIGEEPEGIPEGKYRVVWYDEKSQEVSRVVAVVYPREADPAALPETSPAAALTSVLRTLDKTLEHVNKLSSGYTALVDGYKNEIDRLRQERDALADEQEDNQLGTVVQALVGGFFSHPGAMDAVKGFMDFLRKPKPVDG